MNAFGRSEPWRARILIKFQKRKIQGGSIRVAFRFQLLLKSNCSSVQSFVLLWCKWESKSRFETLPIGFNLNHLTNSWLSSDCRGREADILHCVGSIGSTHEQNSTPNHIEKRLRRSWRINVSLSK